MTSDTLKALSVKVPAITAFFWTIKVLSTTVGETVAYFLSTQLGLGLSNTALIMTGFLVVVLVVQFWVSKYVPSVYWVSKIGRPSSFSLFV